MKPRFLSTEHRKHLEKSGLTPETTVPPGTMFFIYSRCCHAHWEIVFQNGQYRLECEAGVFPEIDQ